MIGKTKLFPKDSQDPLPLYSDLARLIYSIAMPWCSAPVRSHRPPVIFALSSTCVGRVSFLRFPIASFVPSDNRWNWPWNPRWRAMWVWHKWWKCSPPVTRTPIPPIMSKRKVYQHSKSFSSAHWSSACDPARSVFVLERRWVRVSSVSTWLLMKYVRKELGCLQHWHRIAYFKISLHLRTPNIYPGRKMGWILSLTLASVGISWSMQ